MKKESIWNDTKIEKDYKSLNQNIKTDILIIGGGITGINTLYQLRNENAILVERNKLARGTTLNTTGKLTFLQDNIYNNIINIHGEKQAREYLNSQLDALHLALDIINTNNIECDLVKCNSYVFATKEKDKKNIDKLRKFLISNKIKLTKDKYKDYYSVGVENTYLFNPIKYLNGLLKYIKNDIYENTNIIKIEKSKDGYICYTEKNKIEAKKVILACHYPNFLFPYFFIDKSNIEKSYLVAYKNKIKDISAISYDKPIKSIRTYKDYTLHLGYSHKVCDMEKENYNKLIKNLKTKPEYIWSNTDIYTNDYIPYIGLIKENLFLATGYNTWGMLNSFIASKTISDLVQNKKSKYQKLFNPKRNKNFFQFFPNIFYNIKGYINGMKKNKKIKYKKINNIEVMIYEKDGIKHIVKRKCPHLKCNLKFNEIDETFECPCHASKFDIDGNYIKGPSKKSIKIE